MNWQTGFKRIRLVGTAALVLGVLLLVTVIVSQTSGYAPDPAFVQLFGAFWPLGLMMIAVGVLLWLAVWVLSGFVPTATRASSKVEPTEPEPTRARFYS